MNRMLRYQLKIDFIKQNYLFLKLSLIKTNFRKFNKMKIGKRVNNKFVVNFKLK